MPSHPRTARGRGEGRPLRAAERRLVRRVSGEHREGDRPHAGRREAAAGLAFRFVSELGIRYRHTPAVTEGRPRECADSEFRAPTRSETPGCAAMTTRAGAEGPASPRARA